MSDLLLWQYVLIAIIFVWSGFVRSGLGFGGSVLSLPLLLLIDNKPLVFLPIIAVHLLIFSTITVWQNHRKQQTSHHAAESTVNWAYLKKALGIMMVPKLIGVMGLLTLPQGIMSGIIFSIVAVYAVSYILNKPFKSTNPVLDTLFLMLGAYISGTSLIGAPLILSVFSTHVKKEQLRDTLFVLWFILVAIKMCAFLLADVDLQLIHHLWLLPAATAGHIIGLRFHERILHTDQTIFYRILGTTLLLVCVTGFASAFLSP